VSSIRTGPASEIEDPGSAERYPTGDWKLQRPVLDEERCTHCLICWFFCPDDAVLVEGGKLRGFDLDRCKGCGLCSAACPGRIHAIRMEEERP
jgi:pyruvate ferredoxin oxidoreductase delta subunit